MDDKELWTKKYKPKSLRELVGNKNKIKIVKQWINDYKNKVPGTKKVLLLSGEPGLGKTTLAHLILKEYGYQIIEHNSSDIRGKKNMIQVLRRSLVYTNILDIFNNNNNPVGIVMDEIDNLCLGGADRGGFSTFLNIIKEDVEINNYKRKNKEKIKIYNPIICTYNNFSDKKLTELKKYSLHITFTKPNNIDVEKLVNRISKKEDLNFDNDAKIMLINYCNGDLRRLINLLEYLKKKNTDNKIDLDKIENLKKGFCTKNKDFYLFKSVNKILTQKIDIKECLNIFHCETFKIPLFIHENIIKYVNNSKSDGYKKIKMLAKIYHNICKNDIIQTYIFENQTWGLFDVAGLYGVVYPNHYINTLKYNDISRERDISFSSILNKISQKHTNKKLIFRTKKILKDINTNLNKKNFVILSELFYYHLFNKNGDLTSIVKYMISKNIQIEDIDTIIKLKKFNNIEIKKLNSFSSKLKKKMKKIIIQETSNKNV